MSVSIHEDDFGHHEVHLFGRKVGTVFAEERDADLAASFLRSCWSEIPGVIDQEAAKGEPSPESIAADLKTPPPGAVQGAEVRAEGDLLSSLSRLAREFWDRGDDIDDLVAVGLVRHTGVGTPDEDFEITDMGRLAGLR